MNTDPTDAAAYQVVVNDSVMRIFEACSFRDITGQRISKVVETFNHIEMRLNDVSKLIESMSGESGTVKCEETASERRKRELMLNGPQLKGEGSDQDEIDAMFN